MNEEKKILSVEDILLGLNRGYKAGLYVLIVVWAFLLFLGLRLDMIAGTAGVGIVISVIVICGLYFGSIKESCIKNKRLEIKDDIVEELKEVMRRDRYDYYAILKNAGKTNIDGCEYKELQKDDELYVFEYLNKNGKCIIRNIYAKKVYKLSPDLLEFYVRDQDV